MLAQKKCAPCDKGCVALSASEAKSLLAEVPGWELVADGKSISRRVKCKNFLDALDLVNKVAPVAEAENHHPDIKLGWGYAEFLMQTHTINGLHENDFIMASKINALASAS